MEIEGRKIFVAGIADPGRKVRAYLDDALLGDTVTSPTGRFLIEAERDVAVGDYMIHVEVLEPDGVKVMAGAAVPFEREPGEDVAAVAPTAPASAPDANDTSSGKKAAAASDEPAPKLQNVESAVIIRRGDTLWRISHRVYGHGVRYSTIYLANERKSAIPTAFGPARSSAFPKEPRKASRPI